MNIDELKAEYDGLLDELRKSIDAHYARTGTPLSVGEHYAKWDRLNEISIILRHPIDTTN